MPQAPILLRNGNPKEPTTPRRQLEKTAIAECDLILKLVKLHKELDHNYAIGNISLCYTLANKCAQTYRELAKSLYHSSSLLARINNITSRGVAESQRLDYTRYDGFPD